MGGNTTGVIFKVTTFGESHGAATGAVVDGVPAGFELTQEDINKELRRRRPGQNALTTPRSEADEAKIISGVFEGKTTGAPIMILIENTNTKSADYENLKNLLRPSHADFTYNEKYGVRDWRGGGRASARETAARVAAGAIAQKYLKEKAGIEFLSHTIAAGKIKVDTSVILLENLTRAEIEQSPLRCPCKKSSDLMAAEILSIKQQGDSVGSIIRGVIKNVPIGLGEPVFDKISARLASAMLSINAAKGFEVGNGFEAAGLTGSENNDSFVNKDGKIATQANRNGGMLGGISTGETIYFNVAFKPTPTIAKEQQTLDKEGNAATVAAAGRHDPCLAPRAVPVVDAMAAIVIMDLYLISKTQGK